MAYIQCRACGSSNRSSDTKCYNCENSLSTPPPSTSTVSAAAYEESAVHVGEHTSYSKAFVSVVLSAVFGGAIGVGFEFMEVELPFVLTEIILGSACAVFTAFMVALFVEMPDWKRYRRMISAVGFGALVGLALYCIWYAFDPPYGFMAIGAIAGVCSGFPVVVSFGLLGGECRPLGLLEFSNVLGGFLLGACFGFVLLEEVSLEAWIGAAGITALIPTFFGGRINLWEILREFNSVWESWSGR